MCGIPVFRCNLHSVHVVIEVLTSKAGECELRLYGLRMRRIVIGVVMSFARTDCASSLNVASHLYSSSSDLDLAQFVNKVVRV